MKVVHLSTRDIAGGAARAAFRLHTQMLREGIDSSMYVLTKERHSDEKIFTNSQIESRIITPLRTLINQYSKVRSLGELKYAFSIDILGSNVIDKSVVADADLVIMHWTVSSFMTIPEIGRLVSKKRRVLWVLHDMWAMTGGCHYSFDCDEYVDTKCKHCPQVKCSGQSTVSKFFNKKIKFYSEANNLRIVTPSVWLANCAKQSEILRKLPIKTIPNTLDAGIFKSTNKTFAKMVFGVDNSKKLILFVAENGNSNPYKGWSYLVEAMQILNKTRDYNVMVIGSDYDPVVEQEIGCSIKFTGRLVDDYSLAMAYNAADVFVTPSLADNLPNTVLESLHCGTPVVAFGIGGIVDMIKHQENGYLAKYKSSEDIALGLQYVLDNSIRGGLPECFRASNVVKEYINFAKYEV